MAYRNSPTPARNRKRLLLPILGILLIAIVAIAVLLIIHLHKSNQTKTTSGTAVRKTNSVDYSPAKPSEKVDNEDRKSSPSPSNTLDDGSSMSSSSDFNVQITNAANNNGNVHVGTLVNGTTTGDCSLTATQGNQTISLASSIVQQDVNNYGCGVYNIATSKFPTSGAWKLLLTVTNNNKSATNAITVTI